MGYNFGPSAAAYPPGIIFAQKVALTMKSNGCNHFPPKKTVNTYKTRVYNKTRAINTLDLYKYANESKLF